MSDRILIDIDDLVEVGDPADGCALVFCRVTFKETLLQCRQHDIVEECRLPGSGDACNAGESTHRYFYCDFAKVVCGCVGDDQFVFIFRAMSFGAFDG